MYTQHTPLLMQTLEALAKGKLPEADYPHIANAPGPGKDCRCSASYWVPECKAKPTHQVCTLYRHCRLLSTQAVCGVECEVRFQCERPSIL